MSQSFPLDDVRARFPALAGEAGRIFLDNPAGTQVPDLVIDAVSDCFRRAFGNLGGYFATSRLAEETVARAHRQAALFCGAAGPQEIAIAASMTELTYAAGRAIARRLEPGDEIVVTSMDHEANVSPWLQVAEDYGLTLRKIRFDDRSWRIEPGALAEVLSARTKLLAVTYASNLSGAINPVAELTALAKQAGALVYVDAVQFAPHDLIDVAALGCDFLVCSAYKFFGPHISMLWGREEVLQALPAERLRCASAAPGGRFERGTPQIELQAGFSAAIDYMLRLGRSLGAEGAPRNALTAAFGASRAYEEGLMRQMIEGLTAIPGLTLRGPADLQRLDRRVPTFSVTSDRVSSRSMAAALAVRGIYAWSGHNYAYEIALQLGLDTDDGVLRLGAAHYNSAGEIARTLNALEDIARG
ncbi:MAG: cysteine desulfurase-like protein [Rhodospirillales bacterium]|nr:cysteine desulfurase-like protein [Rhodospirillales bacterium]